MRKMPNSKGGGGVSQMAKEEGREQGSTLGLAFPGVVHLATGGSAGARGCSGPPQLRGSRGVSPRKVQDCH
jgi:hypothetical protein